MQDAEVAIVALSSTCGTAKVVVDKLRSNGLKAGLLKIRFLRPFPAEEIVASLSKIKAAAVLDRSESFSDRGGPLFSEVRSALYESKNKPLITNYIYGLGGRDIDLTDIESVYNNLFSVL